MRVARAWPDEFLSIARRGTMMLLPSTTDDVVMIVNDRGDILRFDGSARP